MPYSQSSPISLILGRINQILHIGTYLISILILSSHLHKYGGRYLCSEEMNRFWLIVWVIDKVCYLLACSDLWNKMVLKFFFTMIFTCSLLSWWTISSHFKQNNNMVVFPFPLHNFMQTQWEPPLIYDQQNVGAFSEDNTEQSIEKRQWNTETPSPYMSFSNSQPEKNPTVEPGIEPDTSWSIGNEG